MSALAAEQQPLVEIRSFRTVFDLERRLYRIDRLRLNPGGVPVRGIVYLLALLLGVTLLSGLPLARAVAGVLPWYVRYLLVPAALAALLTVIRIEGRPFHPAAASMLRWRLAPRHLSGLAPATWPRYPWRPPDLVFVADGSHARLRRLLVRGPGALLIRGPHERVVWRDGCAARVTRRPLLTIRELPARAPCGPSHVIDLARGVRVDVRPLRGRRRCGHR